MVWGVKPGDGRCVQIVFVSFDADLVSADKITFP